MTKLKRIIISSTITYRFLVTGSNATNSVSIERQALPSISLDKKVLKFANNILSKYKKMNLKVDKVEILSKAKVQNFKNYKAYVMGFNLSIDSLGKISTQRLTDIFFVGSDGVIATQLFSVEGKNLKEETIFDIDSRYYTREHLLKGKFNAKKKVVIFSDFFCPFCKKTINEIKNTTFDKDTAFFLVEFPIVQLHPAAKNLAAIAKQIHRKKINISNFKIYSKREISKLVKENDLSKLVMKIEKLFSIKLDTEELIAIDMINVERDIQLAERVGVSKTPTLLLNGKRITGKDKIKNLLN